MRSSKYVEASKADEDIRYGSRFIKSIGTFELRGERIVVQSNWVFSSVVEALADFFVSGYNRSKTPAGRAFKRIR